MAFSLRTALKGFCMGAANVVPGVSGGTIALISGIYERIIEALNSLISIANWKMLLKGRFKDFWKVVDGGFILSLALGMLVSIFSLAKLLQMLLRDYPTHIWAFFFGLIACSAVFMLKGIKAWGWTDVLLTVCGIGLGLIICTLSPTSTPDELWFIFICGAIGICTMILPGISGSFILVVLGKYDYIMGAISQLNLPVLMAFALGCAVGLLAFAKLLHWLLARFDRQTMLVLTGFVLGSLVKVWPWGNAADNSNVCEHIMGPCICIVAGVAVIFLIEILSEKLK